ncbi:MAG TPA: HAD family phosphatase [Candidatus Sulfotelmatobacter sp.]|nr:HAD family phosphatase [Candidatus Sulfotelmatobacter sp.]
MPDPFVPRAILFDFDGVLVDSEPVRFRCGAQALEEIGISLSWERFLREWLGRTDDAALRDLLGERFAADGPGIVARRNALYEARLKEVVAFPDAVRLLRRLPDHLKTALATGSRRHEVEAILSRLGLASAFHAIVSAGDYARAKPAPDPFLVAAERLGVPPASCLVIEDSPAGVNAARAAGMAVVAVDRRESRAAFNGATWRLGSLDGLSIDADGVRAAARGTWG